MNAAVHWSLPNNQDQRRTARFDILRNVLQRDEVDTLLSYLPDVFDTDSDTVDDAPTYEFYLEKSGDIDASLATIPGKPDAKKEIREKRRPHREKIAKFVRPLLQQRVLPFVQKKFPQCNGSCEVCWSFVRRYRDDERTTHDMHFDLNALVTVVISLSDTGIDFDGGLYVSAGASGGGGGGGGAEEEPLASPPPSRFFLPLEKGDAVIHQSDLLHGVKVMSGERWSWVLWLKESGCDSDPSVWRYKEGEEEKAGRGFGEEKDKELDKETAEVVEEEDPISLFLQAKRTNSLASKVSLMHRSSSLGFCRAHNEMGMLHLNGGDEIQAEQKFHQASELECGEGDGFYNLGNRYIQQGMIEKAVASFVSGAERGSTLAMFNVGVANLKGAGGLNKNVTEARRWFERCGSVDANYALATTYLIGSKERYVNLVRAKRKGHADAAMLLEREEDEYDDVDDVAEEVEEAEEVEL